MEQLATNEYLQVGVSYGAVDLVSPTFSVKEGQAQVNSITVGKSVACYAWQDAEIISFAQLLERVSKRFSFRCRSFFPHPGPPSQKDVAMDQMAIDDLSNGRNLDPWNRALFPMTSWDNVGLSFFGLAYAFVFGGGVAFYVLFVLTIILMNCLFCCVGMLPEGRENDKANATAS